MNQPYESYKPSGIDWLGDIPNHWEIRKVGRSFDLIGSGTTPESGADVYYKDGTINWVNTGDLNDGILNSCEKRITEKALSDYSTLKIYPVGTILIAMYGATIGKISLLNMDACTNQACCALSDSEFLMNKYAFYWFWANKEHIVRLGYGGGQPNISQNTIRNLRVFTPPLSEQRAIADYLDRKTAQIDQLVARKEQLLALLQQKRQAIINEAVTRGLDANAPKKDSGIEWLGEIPAHWEVKKLKYVASLKSGDTITSETIEDEGEYPVYGGGGFRGYTSSYTHDGHYALIGRQGALCGNINYAQGKFWASEHALVVSLLDNYETIWLGELLRTMNLNQYSQSSAQPGISADRIQNLHIPVPPLDEQRVIVEYISTKSKKINQAAADIKTQLTHFKTYRQSLISEVVTGKVDVRTKVPAEL